MIMKTLRMLAAIGAVAIAASAAPKITGNETDWNIQPDQESQVSVHRDGVCAPLPEPMHGIGIKAAERRQEPAGAIDSVPSTCHLPVWIDCQVWRPNQNATVSSTCSGSRWPR